MIANFSRRASDESVTSWRSAGLFAADTWGFGTRATVGVQATFGPGDIALIGYQADTINSAKSFAFVLLSEGLRGQTISFTDNGWFAAGGFRTGEGTVSVTIAADATIGTVFTLAGVSGNFNLSTSGDQIAAYVGTASSPTFLFGLDFADGNATYAADATSSNTSAVPTGLAFGDTALAFGTDNGAYTGPFSGSKADILAAIADESNWTLDDAAAVGYAPGFTVTSDGAATVSIGDVSIAEGDAGTQVLTFTVTRSNTDSAFTVDYATADGTATAGDDYQATSGQLVFGVGGNLSQTISVTINGDTQIENSETFAVNLTNLNPLIGATAIGDAQGIGTILNDDISISFIHDVQGPAFFSPILAAEGVTAFNVASTAQVTVRGVVTAIDSFAGSGTQGFYITEETSDWDGNPLTSEGIYVRTSAATAGLTVGETVTVTANVMESQTFSNLNRTILVNPSAILQGNDVNALPTFVIDGTPGHSIPTAIISDDNPNFFDSDGSSGTFDPQNDALDFYETIEGMRVTMTNMIVGDGFVGGSNDNFVYFNAYSYDNADKNFINSRGGYTAYGDAQFYPDENTADPNDDVKFGGATSTDGALHGDIIELDFGDVGRGGTSGFDQDLTMGDQLGNVSGIVDFDFGVAKFYVTDALDADKVAGLASTTPIQEVTTLGDDDRALTIATFNVENLSPVGTTFSTNNGVEITTQAKYDQLAHNVAVNLNSPDIICVEEVQDNNGVDPSGGTDATQTWEQLVAAVNAATGKTYQWVDEAPEQPNDVGGAPGGNIRVGFLYDTARVQLGDLAGDATIEERRQYTDRIGDGVRDAGDKLAVDDTGAGINPDDWSGTRRSIVGEFNFHGQTVNVFGNHLPSKGGSDDPYTINQDNPSGNPTNGDWDLRNTLAEQINNVFEKASATGGLLVSGGDYNEFWYNRPLEVLTGYANPDGTANTTGTKYVNLMVQELAPQERFTYDFDGRSQALDALLTDQTLAGVASYDAVHINTGYNDRAGAVNPASSDHDPSVASFDFRDLAETLDGTDADDLLDGRGGDDVLSGGLGNDTLIGGLGDDLLDGGEGRQDAADYRDATVGVAVSLAITSAQDTHWGNDTLIGIERLYGSALADVLTGDDAANRINSAGGADAIAGGGGNDVIVIAANVASVDGGLDTDQVIVGSALFGVTDATFTGVEKLTVRDSAVVDLSGLSAPLGSVTIESVAGGGVLFTGSRGADKIVGGAGDDVLAGGVEGDTVTGGAGADIFAFRDLGEIAVGGRRDLIADFSHADGDRIDLSALDANPDAIGTQHLTFIGGTKFSGTPGTYELRVTAPKGGNDAWRVQLDTNHDRVADHVFLVVTDGPLTADDFILTPPQAFAPHEAAAHAFAALAEVSQVRMDTVGQIHLV